MITRIALMFALAFGLVAFPVLPIQIEEASVETEVDFTWGEFYADAYVEYHIEFTKLYNSMTYKRSANGRSMVNGKFVRSSK